MNGASLNSTSAASPSLNGTAVTGAAVNGAAVTGAAMDTGPPAPGGSLLGGEGALAALAVGRFGSRGSADAAIEALLAEMRASGIRADVDTYGTLLDAAVRAGSTDVVLGVLGGMRLAGVAPDGAVFTSLMKHFRQQGNTAQVGRWGGRGCLGCGRGRAGNGCAEAARDMWLC